MVKIFDPKKTFQRNAARVAKATQFVQNLAKSEDPLRALTEAVSSALVQFTSKSFSIESREISKRLLGIEGCISGTVRTSAEGIDVEIEDAADALQFRLVPDRVFFAPRGAKEISFRISPIDIAHKPLVREAVAQIGAMVAQALVGAFGGKRSLSQGAPFVDRDGAVLRMDLRSHPMIKELQERTQFPILDVFTLSDLKVSDRGLELTVGLPSVP